MSFLSVFPSKSAFFHKKNVSSIIIELKNEKKAMSFLSVFPSKSAFFHKKTRMKIVVNPTVDLYFHYDLPSFFKAKYIKH